MKKNDYVGSEYIQEGIFSQKVSIVCVVILMLITSILLLLDGLEKGALICFLIGVIFIVLGVIVLSYKNKLYKKIKAYEEENNDGQLDEGEIFIKKRKRRGYKWGRVVLIIFGSFLAISIMLAGILNLAKEFKFFYFSMIFASFLILGMVITYVKYYNEKIIEIDDELGDR